MKQTLFSNFTKKSPNFGSNKSNESYEHSKPDIPMQDMNPVMNNFAWGQPDHNSNTNQDKK
jgi:hypothetical protein